MSFQNFRGNNEILQEKRKTFLIAGAFFFGILFVFFCVGCYLLARQIQASKYTAIEAVVVDYRIVYENDPEAITGQYEIPIYYDIVEYEVNGHKYQKTCDTSASKNNLPNNIGKILTIYVNPDNPKDVVFRNSTHIVLTVACLLVPTVGFVIIGFVFRYAHKLKKMI